MKQLASWICVALVSVSPGPSAFQAEKQDKRGCTVSAQPLSFGNYDTMGNTPLDGQGRVTYRCSNRAGRGGGNAAASAKWIVSISLSAGNAGSFRRYLQGPLDRLTYNVYADAQRQVIWGDGTAGSHVVTDQAKPNNREVVIPVYGRIVGAQDVGAGVYSDSLIVTIDF